jgi:hypothetical protein
VGVARPEGLKKGPSRARIYTGMRPKLVGPWEPILKKRIAEMRLRSIRRGMEDDY